MQCHCALLKCSLLVAPQLLTGCSASRRVGQLSHMQPAAHCRFHLPDHLHMANLQVLAEKRAAAQPGSAQLLDARDSSHNSGLFELFAKEVDDRPTWAVIPWLRTITTLPIYVKVGA
eukprot:GHRQ01014367.1.p3 GENE.GHRQ01014367.1~~GHRQ01014367.1.p3  ORF type:complete len:117 (+),score=46.97 GHRQ01014367.1:606-956(+)